jgi:hypothetical protein
MRIIKIIAFSCQLAHPNVCKEFDIAKFKYEEPMIWDCHEAGVQVMQSIGHSKDWIYPKWFRCTDDPLPN